MSDMNDLSLGNANTDAAKAPNDFSLPKAPEVAVVSAYPGNNPNIRTIIYRFIQTLILFLQIYQFLC